VDKNAAHAEKEEFAIMCDSQLAILLKASISFSLSSKENLSPSKYSLQKSISSENIIRF
jgi:hypothetical protein